MLLWNFCLQGRLDIVCGAEPTNGVLQACAQEGARRRTETPKKGRKSPHIKLLTATLRLRAELRKWISTVLGPESCDRGLSAAIVRSCVLVKLQLPSRIFAHT